MPLLLTVLPYIICGGILWFVVLQCAPIGSTITLWEVIAVVFLLGIAQRVWQSSAGSSAWLIDTAIHFAVLVLLLAGIVRLTVLNALKAATIYFAIFLSFSAIIRIVTGK